MKVNSSVPKNHVGTSGKGLTNSMTLRNRNRPKSKQKENIATTDVCIQSFVKILIRYTLESKPKKNLQILVTF